MKWIEKKYGEGIPAHSINYVCMLVCMYIVVRYGNFAQGSSAALATAYHANVTYFS